MPLMREGDAESTAHSDREGKREAGRRPQVLHVLPTMAAEYGGPTNAMPGLARAAVELGYGVTVAHTSIAPPVGLAAIPEVRWIHFARSWPRRFSASRQFRLWLRRELSAFTVVHLHGVFSLCLLRAARECVLQRRPYIVRPHGSLDPYDLRKKALAKRLLGPTVIRRYLAGAALLHCTSEREARSLVQYGASRRVLVAPLALAAPSPASSSDVGRLERKLGLDPRDFVVLGMSRLHPKKNFEILISAVGRLVGRFPRLRLLIAGSGDLSYEHKLRALAAQAAPGGEVRFGGFLSGTEKYAALQRANVFALPSANENFGVAVVEAMRLGLPVVVSHDVYISDQIATHHAGIVCDADPAAVASALEQLLLDSEGGGRLAERLGASAMAMIDALFGERVCQEQLALLYDQALAHDNRDQGKGALAYRGLQ